MRTLRKFKEILIIMLLLLPSVVIADGTEALGPATIEIQDGSGVLVAGTGMVHQPGEIDFFVPLEAEIKQVILYWQGFYCHSPDDTISIKRAGGSYVPVTGMLIGGPFSTLRAATYRIDITHLGLVEPGSNSLVLTDMDFGNADNGAGVLVVYDDGSGLTSLKLRDGSDYAYKYHPIPLLRVMTPQTFVFDPAPVSRPASLEFFFSSVEGEISGGTHRPTSIEVTIGGVLHIYSDLLGSHDGEEWDTLVLDIEIPAGITSVTVQPHSRDDHNSGHTPASMVWNMLNLFIPDTNPSCEPGGPYVADCQGEVTEILLEGFICSDPEGAELTYNWSTDCEESTLVGPDQPEPVLALTLPGDGFPQACNVFLTVSDGVNEQSYETTVNVAACPLDCFEVPLGTAQYDRCGVCDGNDECVDCADVPFGLSIFDSQIPPVCCLPTEIDKCGVCFGDGTSCEECVEVNVLSDINILELSFNDQVKHLRKLIRAAKRTSCGLEPENLRKLTRMLKRLKRINNQSALFVTQIPPALNNCGEGSCVEINNQEELDSLSKLSKKLRKLARRAAAIPLSCTGGECEGDTEACVKRMQNRLRLKSRNVRKANRLHRGYLNVLNNIPANTLQCE